MTDDNDDNDITPCYDWYNRGRGLTCAAPDLYDKLQRPQALLTVCRDDMQCALVCSIPYPVYSDLQCQRNVVHCFIHWSLVCNSVYVQCVEGCRWECHGLPRSRPPDLVSPSYPFSHQNHHHLRNRLHHPISTIAIRWRRWRCVMKLQKNHKKLYFIVSV